MQTIRTTVNIREDTHRYLSELAYREKRSLGEILDMYFRNKNLFLTPSDRNRKVEAFMELRRKLVRAGNSKVSLVKGLREDRDRDNA